MDKKHVAVPIGADLSVLNKSDRIALNYLADAVKMIDILYTHQLQERFYPSDMTEAYFEKYVQEYPKEKKELTSSVTLVRQKEGKLNAFPYSAVFRNELSMVAININQALVLLNNASLRHYLSCLTTSFIMNDYRASDIAWLNVTDAPIEMTAGPYEVYDDHLLGLKGSFGATLGIVLPEETEQLKIYETLNNEFDCYLGSLHGYKPSGLHGPLLVIDEVIAGGFDCSGYVAMAFNLPNDSYVRSHFGSKKVFIRNIIQANFYHIIQPLLDRILLNSTGIGSADLLLKGIVGHELAHGLGCTVPSGVFGNIGSALEESKADVLGIVFLYFLAREGIIGEGVCTQTAILHTVNCIRQLRLGMEEAHALGALIQLNYLLEFGSIFLENERMGIEPRTLGAHFQSLGDQYIKLFLQRDREKAQKFVERWAKPIPKLQPLLDSIQDIPTNIKPEFTYEKNTGV